MEHRPSRKPSRSVTGAASLQVRHIISAVDTSGTGSIGRDDFLAFIRRGGRPAPSPAQTQAPPWSAAAPRMTAEAPTLPSATGDSLESAEGGEGANTDAGGEDCVGRERDANTSGPHVPGLPLSVRSASSHYDAECGGQRPVRPHML